MTKLLQTGEDHLPRTAERQQPDPDGVFAVLAGQAQTRSRADLWTTAIGGAINAAFIWLGHPALYWLAAGFAAVAAYGVWGVADRAVHATEPHSPATTVKRDLLRAVLRSMRGVAVSAGLIAALVAVGGFMAAALGGWNH